MICSNNGNSKDNEKIAIIKIIIIKIITITITVIILKEMMIYNKC